MSKTADFLLGLYEDANCVLSFCIDFEEFCSKMKEINELYLPSILSDVWEEHVASQEPYNVNEFDRRPR
jgi:hypothetical protein|tara:strand:- start:2265 stop:2471 length:207 start_codon:yes stop_codon:yes gene_type:complete